jgi:MFS family permease
LTDILWLFGGVAAILDSTMVTIALHTLVVSLHSTDGAIGWVTTGYLLAIAVGLALAWRLLPADRPSPGAGRAGLT